MANVKSKTWDIKMRQKIPSFVETGSCFDATNIDRIKVRLLQIFSSFLPHPKSMKLTIFFRLDLEAMTPYQQNL
jgi:hypothetical protein